MKKQIISVFLVSCLCMVTLYANAQEEKAGATLTKKNYLVYSSAKGKKSKLDAIVKDFKDYDVIFYGEEHNDSVAHYLQITLFEQLFETYGDKMALSMEMFTRDVQFIMDEYLDGHIKESYFRKDAIAWKNYQYDYRPMVEFAKEKNLDVIAANAAFRYVNIASNNGMEALNYLSDRAKQAIAPLPYDTATGVYHEKLMSMFNYAKGMSHTTDTTKKAPAMPVKMPNRVLGQSLWDATMAYSIYEYLKANPSKKVMHVNGNFHSDEFFGIIPQLKKYNPNLKVLVISSNRDRSESFPKVEFDDYKQLGDYIIITDPAVPASSKW